MLQTQSLSAQELHYSHIPKNYNPSAWEFFVPLTLLIGTAITTFIMTGAPNVQWAFGIAIMFAFCTAIGKGMALKDAIEGVAIGLRGVVLG